MENIFSEQFSKNYETIKKEAQLQNWIEKLKKVPLFAFDIKTKNIDNIKVNLLEIAFAIKPGVAAYIPIANAHNTANYNNSNELNNIYLFNSERILQLLKPVFENKKTFKIGHNLKYERGILQNYGIELRGIEYDIMLESYILDNQISSKDLNSIYKRWMQKDSISIIESSSVEKANIKLLLHNTMWQQLKNNKKLLNVFLNIEMPIVSVLSRIESNGVKIDAEVLKKNSEDISMRLNELELKAHQIVGTTFNLSSTKQLQTIFFEKNGIKPLKKTPKGALSTSEDVLQELALNYSLPKIILEYRSLYKLKSSYTDKLPLMINNKTGRVHTSYHQTVTTTGRLSSTYPNLQNIPVKNEYGRRIRQAFIASEDYVILTADYSQIELRIIAHLSKDNELLKAFFEKKDIYLATASEIFSIPINSVTYEQRCRAKAINFAIIYGISPFGLSRKFKITNKESNKYMNIYFERYPSVLKYIKYIKSTVKKNGYVETIYGRRVYIPNIKSNNAAQRAGAERAAINAPIQGSAAEIIKKAMIAIDAWLEKDKPRVRMIMQVHDELVFEVHNEDIDIVSYIIQNIMENSIKLDVPLLVKLNSGKNLAKASSKF